MLLPPLSPTLSATLIHRLERSSGRISAQAIDTMQAELGFFSRLDAELRSTVALVLQVGVGNFVEWLRNPERAVRLTTEAFQVAPGELTQRVSLRQTVEMVRVATDVFERELPTLARDSEQLVSLTVAVLRYGREIAFAAAGIYATAAESRGAWDARLEALVVDGVVRGDPPDAVASRAAALGWDPTGEVTVVVGGAAGDDVPTAVDELREAARSLGRGALVGVHGSRLVALVGGPVTTTAPDVALARGFGPGPVVVGPVAGGLGGAHASAAAAVAGLRAVAAWPAAPRPVAAADLLPERVLDGDDGARAALLDLVHRPLQEAGGTLATTLDAYLEAGGAVEACARTLFVHANTVRYRLRRVTDLTGLDPTVPRHAHVLRVALALGRLSQVTAPA
ncbi:helix-turn-helix domain-containing protein [Rhodococcus aerolatus]